MSDFRLNTRFLVTFTTLALLVVVLLATAGGAQAAKAPKGFMGIVPQSDLQRSDTSKMFRAGIDTVRIPLAWSTIQPSSANHFSWEFYDRILKVTAREKVKVLPFIYSTPPWVSRKTTQIPVSSHDLTKWRGFLAALVDRYGPKGDFWKANKDVPKMPIRTWQMWNEANFFYFVTPVDPKAYGKLVDASAAAIKHHDAGARIMLSGLYATPKGPPSKAVNADTYLKRLSKYVKKSSFDTIAIHPYSASTAGTRGVMEDLRRAMIKSGYRSKAVQITEIGWGSGSGNAFLKGSESAQASQMRSALNYLVGARHRLNLRKVYWFSWKDVRKSVPTCSFCYSVGLFEAGSGLKPKKAWSTFKSFSYRR